MVIKNVGYFTWVTGDRIIVIRFCNKSNTTGFVFSTLRASTLFIPS